MVMGSSIGVSLMSRNLHGRVFRLTAPHTPIVFEPMCVQIAADGKARFDHSLSVFQWRCRIHAIMPLLVHSAISAMDGGLYHADSCCNFKVHESIGDVQRFGFPPTGELALAGCYHWAEAMHLRHDVQQSPVPNGLSFWLVPQDTWRWCSSFVMRMQHLDFLGWKMPRLEVEIVVCSASLGIDNLGFSLLHFSVSKRHKTNHSMRGPKTPELGLFWTWILMFLW